MSRTLHSKYRFLAVLMYYIYKKFGFETVLRDASHLCVVIQEGFYFMSVAAPAHRPPSGLLIILFSALLFSIFRGLGYFR